MSFGEFVFFAGFIQKVVKVDLYVGINWAYPQRNGHKKVPKDSGGLHTETEGQTSPGGASHPAPGAHRQPPRCNVGSPPPLGCIYTVF
jgi:hypothetical protein